jgi:FG-GAP repeat
MMAQFGQQGPKLVGFLSAGSVAQGSSIALSADGNTAMVGGPSVDAGTGVAWVYIRSADVWSEQDELVGTGAAGNAMQGTSVALSADGNTAIVGGPGDNDRIGAAWVFTRSGGVWSQQGLKLVGTGATINTPESTFQGYSVALSADGNTAVVSGTGDNSGTGAVWVYTRSGGVWYQEGPKLVFRLIHLVPAAMCSSSACLPRAFFSSLDFSNISVHRGRESEKDVVLQQFL